MSEFAETLFLLSFTILLGALVLVFKEHLLLARKSRLDAKKHGWRNVRSVEELTVPSFAASAGLRRMVHITANPAPEGRGVRFEVASRDRLVTPAALLFGWLVIWTVLISAFSMLFLTHVGEAEWRLTVFLAMFLVVAVGAELAAATQFRDIVTQAFGVRTIEVYPGLLLVKVHFLGTASVRSFDLTRIRGFSYLQRGLQFRYGTQRVQLASLSDGEAEHLLHELGLAVAFVQQQKA